MEPREKAIIKGINKILSELQKLEETENFKGVYLDGHYFTDLQIMLIDAKENIKTDNL